MASDDLDPNERPRIEVEQKYDLQVLTHRKAIASSMGSWRFSLK